MKLPQPRCVCFTSTILVFAFILAVPFTASSDTNDQPGVRVHFNFLIKAGKTPEALQAMKELVACFNDRQDGEVVSNLVLSTLIKTEATLFFITHYHGLGDAFRGLPCVEQLCCKLDHSQNPPAYTYKLKPGISGDSDGLIVASEYGVNEDNLEALLEQKARRGDFKLR